MWFTNNTDPNFGNTVTALLTNKQPEGRAGWADGQFNGLIFSRELKIQKSDY
jgi:hypothetical protein